MNAAVELLDQTIAIHRRYDGMERERRQGFNLFTILRRENDEVNLHSRFLFELLNPQGSHLMGTAYLEPFLQAAGIEEFELAGAAAQREYKNMDLLIANAKQAVIVENKIDAPDQPRQLLRYYKTLREEGHRDIWIVYLTLYGDAPSADSAGGLAEEFVIPFSYQSDIRDWLDTCLQLSEPYPALRESLSQYQRLVEDMTGQTSGRQIMDVKNLLSDEEHLAAAIHISQALLETQIEIQFRFWLALEEKLLAEGYEVTEYWKVTRRHIDDYYKKGVRRYGLMVSLPELLDHELLSFFIGVQHRVYYGFVPLEHGSPAGVAQEPGFALLTAILKGLDETWSSSSMMIGWRTFSRRIDFRSFNTPDTLALVRPEALQQTVSELVAEITGVIEQFYEACENDPRLAEAEDW